MTVSTTASGVTRIGDGVTLEFSFSFEAKTAAEILVSNIVGLALVAVAPANYVVAIAPSGVGGTVTFNVAPVNALNFYIYRQTALTQLVSVSNQTRYDPQVVEGVWDKLTFLAQELSELASRSVKTVPGEDPGTLIETLETSAASAAANAIAAAASAAAAALFDPALYLAKADNLSGLASAPAALTNLGMSAFVQSLIDDADAAAVRATLGLATIELGDLDPALYVTAGEVLASNDNDTTLPTSAAVIDFVEGYDDWELVDSRNRALDTSNSDLVLSLTDGYQYRIDGRFLSRSDTGGMVIETVSGGSFTVPFGVAASTYDFRITFEKRASPQLVMAIDAICGVSPGLHGWASMVRSQFIYSAGGAYFNNIGDCSGPSSMTLKFTNHDGNGHVAIYRKRMS